jgi:hypothetical protein
MGRRLREGRRRECASEQGEDASAISKHGLSRRRTALFGEGQLVASMLTILAKARPECEGRTRGF